MTLLNVTRRRQLRCAKRRASHGALIVETMIALFIGLLTGAAMLVLLQITMTARTATLGDEDADVQARAQLETIADKLRNSQPVQSGANKVVFSAAASSDTTIYTNPATNDTLRIWLNTSVSPPALEETQTTSGVATTTVLLSGVSALSFTYYTQSSSQTTSSYSLPLLSWVTTLLSGQPSATEIPLLGAVRITLTTTINGSSRTLTTMVRLRNSPYIASGNYS